MNRVYNNEAIIMACVVHLLKKKNMDMALLYLLSTLLIDNQLSTILRVSVYFEQLSVSIRNQGLISRKLDSFGPYFINALVILKQSNIIEISDGRLQLTNSSFPEGPSFPGGSLVPARSESLLLLPFAFFLQNNAY